MIENGKKYLVTTDHWFVGPDNEHYRAAWGTCQIKTSEEVFGFTPNEPSTNWFIVVGEGEGQILIAGCQVHFAIKREHKPYWPVGSYTDKETGVKNSINKIYIAEE